MLKRDLDRNINGLVDFKTVMQTISIIQSTTLTVEIQVKEMQEIFSILEEHCIRVRWSLKAILIYSFFFLDFTMIVQLGILLAVFLYRYANVVWIGEEMEKTV